MNLQSTYMQKLPKWMSWLVVGCCLIMILWMRRFEIIRVPDHLTLGDFPGGTYLLVDWHFYQGRPLAVHDWILMARHNGKMAMAKIMALSATIPMKDNRYLLELSDSAKSRTWVTGNQISGRVLMFWVPLENLPLPAE